ncbi:hypothetical protein [Olsenella sp. An290]|nr:hypothetical protein [Olsenella sp. An290]
MDGFVQPLFYGTCDALQPAVSYNWGGRRYGRILGVRKARRRRPARRSGA